MAAYSGTSGDDVYNGGSDDDVIEGVGGNDTLSGGDGADQIDGGGGNDILNGGAGDDLIDSGTGADQVDGGTGVDGLSADLSAYGTITFRLDEDYFNAASFPTADFIGIEYLVELITGSGSDRIYTSAGAHDDNVSTGAEGDTVAVYNGHDTVQMGDGSGDVLIVDYSTATSNIATTGFTATGFDYSGTIGAADRSVEFSGVYEFHIKTGSGNDVIQTGFGPDRVETGDGDDFVDFGANIGWGFGGDGIDGMSADLSIRTLGLLWNFATGSFRTVVPSVSGSLVDVIQEFEYVGTLIAGIGNDVIVTASIDRDEVIFTGVGNDAVTAAHGMDQVNSGTGTDILTVDYRGATGSVVSGPLTTTADGYSGRVEAPDRAVDFTGIERFVILGGSAADDIAGGDGADNLDGGAGADLMTGGVGNDHYMVDDAGDVIVENIGEGIDEVRSGLASYSLLGSQVENLSAATNNGQQLRGSAANNVVSGLGGNDVFLLQDGGDDIAFGNGGNDIYYFGAALSAGDRADDNAGRDVVILQGNITTTLPVLLLAGIESLSLQSGANATFGDTANNFYDYDITTVNNNVGGSRQLIVNAQSLRAGEDFTFDGSAETDGKFLVYGGHGVDNLTGGAGVDVFFFEGSRWGDDDKVNGGAGRDALIISGGSGVTHIEFAADALTSIESISVTARYATDPSQVPSYEFVLNNGNVAPGGTLIVNASSLANTAQTVEIDGSAVEDGNLKLFGGGGNDILTAGDGADLLMGGGLSDALTGGAGADMFRYDAASDSTAVASDLIGDFATGTDKVDLTRLDANTDLGGDQAFIWIGASAFTGTGPASAGQLRVYQDGGGYWHAEGDTNGDGTADFAILFQLGTAAPVQSDFLL